jgi:hypothetical protein
VIAAINMRCSAEFFRGAINHEWKNLETDPFKRQGGLSVISLQLNINSMQPAYRSLRLNPPLLAEDYLNGNRVIHE